jgi:hypothetical protein
MYASLPFNCPSRSLGDSEVEQTRHAVGSDEDVLGRHVAVHQIQAIASVVARLVGGVETLQHPAHDAHADERLDAVSPPANRANELRQRGAAHVVHHQEDLVVGGHDVEGGDDVRVRDARRQTRFVEEHLHEIGISGELRVEPLDRHRPHEPGGPQQAPEMHRRHASGRNLAVQHVTPDDPRGICLQGGSHSYRW